MNRSTHQPVRLLRSFSSGIEVGLEDTANQIEHVRKGADIGSGRTKAGQTADQKYYAPLPYINSSRSVRAGLGSTCLIAELYAAVTAFAEGAEIFARRTPIRGPIADEWSRLVSSQETPKAQ